MSKSSQNIVIVVLVALFLVQSTFASRKILQTNHQNVVDTTKNGGQNSGDNLKDSKNFIGFAGLGGAAGVGGVAGVVPVGGLGGGLGGLDPVGGVGGLGGLGGGLGGLGGLGGAGAGVGAPTFPLP